MKLIRITVPYVAAALIVVIAAHWGMSRALGAHPFWSTKIALIGAPIGLAAALVGRVTTWPKRIGLFMVLLAVSGAASHFGRLEFAASFAENALAGQFWFYGWIAVAASVTALLATMFSLKVRSV